MIYLEGFSDCSSSFGDTDEYLERRGHNHTGNEPGTDSGRFDGRALKLQGQQSWWIPVPGNVSYAIGFAFKHYYWNRAGNGATFLRIYNSTYDVHITLQMVGDGGIRIITTEDTVETNNLRVRNDTWCYIEFKCTIDDVDGSYILKVNGKEYFNRTGINTYNSGSKEIAKYCFYWSGVVSYPYLIDDFYISDDLLGDCRVDGIDPDGDGTINDWTPLVGTNYEEIDDGTAIDDDTTYVESNSTTDQDLYIYDNLGALGTIHAIQLNVTCRKTNDGDFNIEQLVRIGTTIYDETPVAVAGQTYETIARVMTIDPSTFSAWTVTNINAAQFGFEATT